jgi:hypothetical protein
MSQTITQANQTADTSIMPLLGDLSNVPPDYIQQVSFRPQRFEINVHSSKQSQLVSSRGWIV